MKNGVEYSKSRNYRIAKCGQYYHIEQAEYRIQNVTWFKTNDKPYLFLVDARKQMRKIEEDTCPQ